jgi:hypothetical protein
MRHGGTLSRGEVGEERGLETQMRPRAADRRRDELLKNRELVG